MLVTNKRLKITKVDEGSPLSCSLIKLINTILAIPNRAYFREADHACGINKKSISSYILGN